MGYSPLFRGNSAKAPSRSLQTNYPNASGSTLLKGTVVAVNTSSQIIKVDPSDEAKVSALVGIVAIDIPNAATGAVSSGGRLEEIAQSFSLGDAIYVGKDGIVTNVKPDYGVGTWAAGDFVIFVGVVVKNEFDITKKDIQLMISVVGQL
jgi:hypothetical protein